MEQIQIRQPKMPAAQSFIQILETFLATLFIFIATYFSYKKLAALNTKQLKPLVSLYLFLKNLTSLFKEKMLKKNKVKNPRYYYILLIFRYISFSSHEKA